MMVDRDDRVPQRRSDGALILSHSITADPNSMETQTSAQNSETERETATGVAYRETSDGRTIAILSIEYSKVTDRTVTRQQRVTFDEENSPRSSRSTIRQSVVSVNSANSNISRHGARRRVPFTDNEDQQLEPGPDITADHLPWRTATCSGVVYHSCSEAEECRESEISLNLSSENPRLRRRRRNSSLRALLSSWKPGEEKRGAVVTDSFVNECICCCIIL